MFYNGYFLQFYDEPVSTVATSSCNYEYVNFRGRNRNGIKVPTFTLQLYFMLLRRKGHLNCV